MSLTFSYADSDSPPVRRVLATTNALVIAHRGYSAIAPENTLPAFALAINAGADLIELDYHHSRDGVPVVIHDDTLDRTTDATNRWGGVKLRVDAHELQRLQTLNAGIWFAPQFKDTRLPTLSQALNAIHDAGGIALIERKAGDAATCVQLLCEKKLLGRVVVQSFDWEYLRQFHQLSPTQVLGALGPPNKLANGDKPNRETKQLSAAWLDSLQETGARIVVWSREVTREAIELAHLRRLKVWIYTIDDPQEAKALLELGANGIITNQPEKIRASLQPNPSP